MEFIIESPCMLNPSRKIEFPVLKWLNKSQFEEYLKLQSADPDAFSIYPYIDQIEGDSNSRIFIGKSLPHSNEGVQSWKNRNSKLEIIGTVAKNIKNEWQLSVTHGSDVFEIKNDFLVLCLSDFRSYDWVKTKLDSIPKFSLRGAIDQFTDEYFYIGCNCLNGVVNGQQWQWTHERQQWNDVENTPPLFGKVHLTHKCLYAPVNNIEVRFENYFTLVLKPSPASLKILCRIKIREMTKQSNENIKLINKNKTGRIYLPVTLINFLKYPSYLSVGEFLLKDERLVREDGQFEMLIENNGNLVVRSTSNNSDLSDDTHVKRIIQNDVSSVWLHRFQLVLLRSDSRLYLLRNFYYNSPEYKFGIEPNSLTPNYFIENDPVNQNQPINHLN